MHATLDDNKVSALAAVEQATTEARKELNKTATGAKTEVGAGFRSRFYTTLCLLFMRINGPSFRTVHPREGASLVDVVSPCCVFGATHVFLWHTRELIPRRCMRNHSLSLSLSLSLSPVLLLPPC
jgi:hypothetical protein